jgi:hypothetical protein
MVAVAVLPGGFIGKFQSHRKQGHVIPYSKNIFVTIILPSFLILVVPYSLVGGRLDFLELVPGS